MSQTQQSQRTYRLEHDGIRSLLIRYTMPAVVGTLVTALYNVVDRIFIGQSVGDYALSGLALTFPVLVLLQAFGMLVGTGAATRVSILLGEHNRDGAERILGNAIVLTFILQAAIIIPTMIWLEPILVLFGGSERTIPYAAEYLYIAVPGNIFASLAMSYNAVMRASGYPSKAMYTMIIGAVLNIGLDSLFIYNFGWGIGGAAWATVLSMAASAAFVMYHFFQKESIVRFRLSNMQISKSQILSIASIGVSPFAVQILGSLSNVLINRGFIAVAPSAEDADRAIGALGVINGYALVGFMIMLGLSQGMQPIVGYNHGAGLHNRVLRTTVVAGGISALVGLVFSIIALLIPRQICSIFAQDGPLLDASVNAMSIAIHCLTFVGTQIVATQFFQSIGHARKAFALSISRQALFLIPLLLTLPYSLGVDGVWLSLPLADLLSGILGIALVWYHFRSMCSLSDK